MNTKEFSKSIHSKHNGSHLLLLSIFHILSLSLSLFCPEFHFNFLWFFFLFFSGDDVYWECKGKVDASFLLRITTRQESEAFLFCSLIPFISFNTNTSGIWFFFSTKLFTCANTTWFHIQSRKRKRKKKKPYAFVNSQLTYNVLAVT